MNAQKINIEQSTRLNSLSRKLRKESKLRKKKNLKKLKKTKMAIWMTTLAKLKDVTR